MGGNLGDMRLDPAGSAEAMGGFTDFVDTVRAATGARFQPTRLPCAGFCDRDPPGSTFRRRVPHRRRLLGLLNELDRRLRPARWIPTTLADAQGYDHASAYVE